MGQCPTQLLPFAGHLAALLALDLRVSTGKRRYDGLKVHPIALATRAFKMHVSEMIKGSPCTTWRNQMDVIHKEMGISWVDEWKHHDAPIEDRTDDRELPQDLHQTVEIFRDSCNRGAPHGSRL